MAKRLRAAALAVVLCTFAAPASADWDCTGSRCAGVRVVVAPNKIHHGYTHRRHASLCEAPPGWGWYRRQKFCEDDRPPLAVFDELAVAPAW